MNLDGLKQLLPVIEHRWIGLRSCYDPIYRLNDREGNVIDLIGVDLNMASSDDYVDLNDLRIECGIDGKYILADYLKWAENAIGYQVTYSENVTSDIDELSGLVWMLPNDFSLVFIGDNIKFDSRLVYVRQVLSDISKSNETIIQFNDMEIK
jgi:hypothetical protein